MTKINLYGLGNDEGGRVNATAVFLCSLTISQILSAMAVESFLQWRPDFYGVLKGQCSCSKGRGFAMQLVTVTIDNAVIEKSKFRRLRYQLFMREALEKMASLFFTHD